MPNVPESTAGYRKSSGSEFQNAGPVTKKARLPKVPTSRAINNNVCSVCCLLGLTPVALHTLMFRGLLSAVWV